MNCERLSANLSRLSLLFMVLIVLTFSTNIIKSQELDFRIMFLSDHDGSVALYTMRDDGTDIQQFINITFEEGGEITSASLSPDGTTLAVSSRKERSLDYFSDEIFLLDLATGDVTMLTNDSQENTSPNWSPDSQYLAYLGDGIFGLFENVNIFDTISQTTEVITTGTTLRSALDTSNDFGINIRWIDWSPDGSQLALVGQTSLPDALNVMIVVNADGTGAQQVTPDEMSVVYPTWSTEPNLVYVVCSAEYGVYEICQIDIQTLQIEQISNLITAIPDVTHPYITSLDISPEGKFIFGYGDVINEPIYQFDISDGSITLISSVTSDGYELIGWVDVSSIPCTSTYCYTQP